MAKDLGYRLTKEWNDSIANYEYTLHKRVQVRYTGDVDATLEEELKTHGDLGWAKKIAKHYKITLPE